MGEADPSCGSGRRSVARERPRPGCNASTETTWAGFARTDGGMTSGSHHHGEYESVIYVLSGRFRLESGPAGVSVVDAGPGDFLFVPRGSIHREGNPAEVQGTAIVVRSGRGEAVVNVEGPAPSDA